jgi:hypothetical protein
VYDVGALSNKNKSHLVKDAEIPVERLEQLWVELIGSDVERAYRAIQTLGAAGSRSAGFLKARLKSGPEEDERRISQLIADLDNEEYAAREKASRALKGLGARAESALRQTLKGDVSAEASRRIKRLLSKLDPGN